jgi:hypothetical protein
MDNMPVYKLFQKLNKPFINNLEKECSHKGIQLLQDLKMYNNGREMHLQVLKMHSRNAR